MTLDRRSFIKSTLLTSCSFMLPPAILDLWAGEEQSLRLGLITDLHKDIIHDADLRLQSFLAVLKEVQPHAKIQLGDFATPKEENQSFIDSFNQDSIPSLHVMGNHDLDEGYTKEQVIQSYGMSAAYYAQLVQGIRILVLDGNDLGSPKSTSGYASYIGKAQQDWLNQELSNSKEPVLIFSHQPIAGIYTMDNAAEIQALLSAHASKIILAINGHAHVDQFLKVGGVSYLHLNSASYYWVGEKHSHWSMDAATHVAYPSLSRTCPYAEVLFGILTLDRNEGKLTLTGRKSSWIGPSPMELGYGILSKSEQELYLQPQISDRKIS
ncbi:MAG: metallophosphoesterase [Algoriphagus sp.]|nr:metallophosphoesterase [Algoriphagus sp.]